MHILHAMVHIQIKETPTLAASASRSPPARHFSSKPMHWFIIGLAALFIFLATWLFLRFAGPL
jgi:hypothetical protein